MAYWLARLLVYLGPPELADIRVDWRACIDPLARAVEVNTSHIGMAIDPRVIDHVSMTLRGQAAGSALEVDRGEIA